LLADYTNQARTYDRTRGASPSILRPLIDEVEPAPGRDLADVGGGTGNYAAALREAGWRPLVIDRSPAMLAGSAEKGLPTLESTAESLSLEDGSFDAVTMISVLHHLDDPPAALAEARRILRPGGRLAIVAFLREDIDDLWLLDYFPISRSWMDETHPPFRELAYILPGATRSTIEFEDLQDASLAALASHPQLILERDWRRQTSYFERLARDHPAELDAGLDRLRADIEAGAGPSRPGRATLVSWAKP
jgi:demethylmenaquinone methyltransferase/2-methoxy-6-polyprenyl-1,4-benzoquinol methylase